MTNIVRCERNACSLQHLAGITRYFNDICNQEGTSEASQGQKLTILLSAFLDFAIKTLTNHETPPLPVNSKTQLTRLRDKSFVISYDQECHDYAILQDLEAAFHNLFAAKISDLCKLTDISEAELNALILINSLDQAFYEALFNPLMIEEACARKLFLPFIIEARENIESWNSTQCSPASSEADGRRTFAMT